MAIRVPQAARSALAGVPTAAVPKPTTGATVGVSAGIIPTTSTARSSNTTSTVPKVPTGTAAGISAGLVPPNATAGGIQVSVPPRQMPASSPTVPNQNQQQQVPQFNLPFPMYFPIPQPAIPVRDRSAIEQYVNTQINQKLTDAERNAAQARTQAQQQASQILAGLENQRTQAVERLRQQLDQFRQGVQTAYERNEALERDQRTLEDVANQRRLNPFSGRSDYALGMIERERAITDRQQSEDLANRIAQAQAEYQLRSGELEKDYGLQTSKIQQDLAATLQRINDNLQALKDATPAERERLIREIEADERQYELALRGAQRDDILANAGLANQQFQQALQSFNSNLNALNSLRDYQLQLSQLMGEFQGRPTLAAQQFAAQEQQRRIENARDLEQRYGVPVTPTYDYSLMLEQVKGIPPLIKQKFDMEARQFGVETALRNAELELRRQGLNQQAAELALSRDRFNFERSQAEKPDTNAIIRQLNDLYVSRDPITGENRVTNTQALRNAIIALNLPDSVTDQLLLYYGLPVNPG